jgi:hypothetical protein
MQVIILGITGVRESYLTSYTMLSAATKSEPDVGHAPMAV